MKKGPATPLLAAAAALCAGALSAQAVDSWTPRVDEWLGVSLLKGNVKARVSGLLDLEGYYVEQPPSGLVETRHGFLLNPRLTLNLDAQFGSHFYGFVEMRVDRGFDPHDSSAQTRLDQYALAFKPWPDQGWRIQVGKFATVIGNWSHRYDSWTNPFINAPLPYENVTPIYDREVPADANEFLTWRNEVDENYERTPIIWGPSLASGVAIYGQVGKFNVAAEMKNASLSSRPEEWDATQRTWQHPTWSGRFGWEPTPAWNLGFSASAGPYLVSGAMLSDPSSHPSLLPRGKNIGDYREIVLGQDLSFAWHHWEFWAEFFETRFEVPRIGDADTFAYYLEAKYKFTPQFYGALRWNQQLYSTVRNDEGDNETWGNDIWRIDTALTYRFTPDVQARIQYSIIRQQLAMREWENFLAGQVTVRF